MLGLDFDAPGMIENRLHPPPPPPLGWLWLELGRCAPLPLPPASAPLPLLLTELGKPSPILLVWCLSLVTAASSSLPSAHASSSSDSARPPPTPSSPLRRPESDDEPLGKEGVDAENLWPARGREAVAMGGEAAELVGGCGLDVSLGWLAEARRR